MLNALLSVVLVVVSLAVLLYLLRLLYTALRLPLDGFLHRRRFARAVSRARRCDALLEAGRLDAALRELHAAFYLETPGDRAMVGTVANHHTGLLSRLISLTTDAHGTPVRLLSLAKADRLLEERRMLQQRYFVVAQGGGRDRARQVEAQLRDNRQQLQATLRTLLDEVRTARRRPQYH